jgi:hypothetical protein
MKKRIAPVVLTFALLACTPTPSSPPAAIYNRQTTGTFSPVWKPSTIVLTTAQASALENPDSTNGIYRFLSLPSGVVVGGLLFVPNVGLLRVGGIANEAGKQVLTTTPASLLEAAESGTMDWGVNMAAASSGAQIRIANLHPQTITQGGPVSFEGKIGKFKLKAQITPAGNQFNLQFEGTYEPGANVAGSGTIGGSGYIRLGNVSGGATFNGGTVSEFRHQLEQFEGQFTVTANLSDVAGNAKLKLPMAITVPFNVGGVPLYLMFSVTPEITSSISLSNSRLSGNASLSFNGRGGFALSGGVPEPSAAFNATPSASGGNGSASTPNTAGIGLAVDAPRIDLGIGLPALGISVATDPNPATGYGSLFVKNKVELVLNHIFSGNPPRPCLTLNKNIGIFAGGEFSLFGFGAVTERQLVGWNAPPQRNGAGCS